MPFVSEFFLTQLLGRRVTDPSGRSFGRLKDLVCAAGETFPRITKLLVKSGRRERVIPWSCIGGMDGPQLFVRAGTAGNGAVLVDPSEMLLAGQVLDRQIVDVEGRKVVRVNDLKIAGANGGLRLMAADIGFRGLLRRLGLERAGELAAGLVGKRLSYGLLSWECVATIPEAGTQVQLTVPQRALSRLHPADLAEIVVRLSAPERSSLVQSLDDEKAADLLEEFEPDMQASILDDLETEDAADILEAMVPDDAADALGEVSPERAEELLAEMEPDEAAEVRELLAFPEDTAGGLMTSEYVDIAPDMTIAQALDHLRAEGSDVEVFFYTYVVDQAERLLGVLSLRELIVADPSCRVEEVMMRDVISVTPGEKQDEVARLIAKYDLLAVPVVNGGGKLRGVVTVDDAIDTVIPTVWKKRLPRFYR